MTLMNGPSRTLSEGTELERRVAEYGEAPEVEALTFQDGRSNSESSRASTDAASKGLFASKNLKTLLGAFDALGVSVAFIMVAIAYGWPLGASSADVVRGIGALTFAVTFALILIATHGLYLARVSSVRTVELAILGRVVVLTGIALFLVAERLHFPIGVLPIAIGCVLAYALLATSRGIFAGWLGRRRAAGAYCRDIVIIGGGAESLELCKLLALHPEAGYTVVGVCGPRQTVKSWPNGVAWLGELESASELLVDAGSNGALLAASDLGSDDLNDLARKLAGRGVHVQISSGLRGIGHRRLRALPIAHEALYYIEPVAFSPFQMVVKRIIDLVASLVGLILLSPLLLVAAILVKISDRGPVFFRQARIGHDGVPFTILKLRTMITGAEDFLPDVISLNSRRGGPLFKTDSDPRRTNVGRFLERTSLDEIPQLWNVVRGDMSLVGPRPALPCEVEGFDPELLDRHRVLPGITGLWQVEARDRSEFDIYRRLDLYYVENWTVGLDLAILVRTFTTVLRRSVTKVKASRSGDASARLATP